MGVYIKGMEMPESCSVCPLMVTVEYEEICSQTGEYVCQYDRADDCPLVPVKPHGRLIDADALMREFDKAQRTMAQHGREYSCSFMSSSQELSTEWYCVEDMLENAPTIIPAELPVHHGTFAAASEEEALKRFIPAEEGE